MDFIQLKQNIKNKFYPVLLVDGKDDYLLALSIKSIKDGYVEELQDLNYFDYDFNESVNSSLVFNAIETIPAMSDKKVIVLRNLRPKNRGCGISVEDLRRLVKYTEKPNNYVCLVIVRPQVKDLHYSEKVNCDYLDSKNLSKWVANYVNDNNRKIEQKNIDLLLDYSGRDMMKISKEIKKLCDYTPKYEAITKESIEKIVEKSLEYTIFDIANKLAECKKKEVLDLLNEILSNQTYEEAAILGTLFSTFRRMMHVSLSKETDEELARLFSVQTFAITRARNLAKKFTQIKLKKCIDILVEADINMKQNQINRREVLNNAVLSLLNV